MKLTLMTNNKLIDTLENLRTMNAEDCAAAIDELRNELARELWCAQVSSDYNRPAQSAAKLEAQWESACENMLSHFEVVRYYAAACAPHRAAAKANAAEEAQLNFNRGLNAAEKARLNGAANKTKAVGGFIDSLASCNTTSILLVGGGLFAIFCTILFTIST